MVQSQQVSIPIAKGPDDVTTGPEEEYSDDLEAEQSVPVNDSTHLSDQQKDAQRSRTNHDDHDINETDGSDETDEEDLRRQEEEKQSEVIETAKPMDRESVHSGQRSANPKQEHVGHIPDSVSRRIDEVLSC